MRRKVLQDGDGIDEGEDTAMDVGDEADSQVSYRLRGRNVHYTCMFIKAASSTQVFERLILDQVEVFNNYYSA